MKSEFGLFNQMKQALLLFSLNHVPHQHRTAPATFSFFIFHRANATELQQLLETFTGESNVSQATNKQTMQKKFCFDVNTWLDE